MVFLYQFHAKKSMKDLKADADQLIGNKHFKGIEIKANPFDEFNGYLVDYYKALRQIQFQYDPMITAHLPILDFGNYNQDVAKFMIQILKDSIRDTQEFGIKQYVLHAATTGNQDLSLRIDIPSHKAIYDLAIMRRRQVFEMTAQVLHELAEYADKRDYDIQIGIENVLLDVEVVYSSEDVLRMIELANHPKINAVFDVAHAHRAKQDIPTFIQAIRPQLGHVHINDNDGLCDLHALPGTLAPGEGIDFASVFQAFQANEYSGTILIEAYYPNAQALIDAKNHLATFIQE